MLFSDNVKDRCTVECSYGKTDDNAKEART
jgi:hypothetical protein